MNEIWQVKQAASAKHQHDTGFICRSGENYFINIITMLRRFCQALAQYHGKQRFYLMIVREINNFALRNSSRTENREKCRRLQFH